MDVNEFFHKTTFNKTFLIGYYGGGNFGDELLLEIILLRLARKRPSGLKIFYKNPEYYKLFHHNFGYEIVGGKKIWPILKAVLTSKHIIVGGGGIWGLDFSRNNFLLSGLLFFARFALGKQVSLLGVGYYSSTTKLGHFGAYLAGKSSTHIVARDQESYDNFKKVSSHTFLDKDLAFLLPELDTSAYEPEATALAQKIPIKEKVILITLRRFQEKYKNPYFELIKRLVETNLDKNIALMLLEPKTMDPKGYESLLKLSLLRESIHITDFSFNPLAFVKFLQNHSFKLILITPQFHSQLVAFLYNIPFLPISYDNKSNELFAQSGITNDRPIKSLVLKDLQTFIDTHY